MNISSTIGDILDTIQEYIVFKSGILLDYNEIKEFLRNINTDLSSALLINEEDFYYRFRPEEIEFIINEIRVHIGELDDSNPFPILKMIKTFPEYIEDFQKAAGVSQYCLDKHIKDFGIEKPLGKEYVDCLVDKSGVSKRVADMLFYSMAQTLNRSITYTTSIKEWDGVVKLSDLFNSETLPSISNTYFDQRYIDYLSKNTDSLYSINWRQFEGLTAEYFNRNGFEVHLGSGRKDGGIDVYAVDKKNSQILIIQCKRYSKNKTVDVNSVKALYYDHIENNADYALLATTSRIAPEGRKIMVRHHVISEAEHNSIIEWVESMQTFNKL